MLAENLCRKAKGLIGSQRSVGIYLQGQLVIVCHLTYTGILHIHVDALHRCIDGIHGDHSDREIIALIPVRTDIAASVGNGKLHVEPAVRTAA